MPVRVILGKNRLGWCCSRGLMCLVQVVTKLRACAGSPLPCGSAPAQKDCQTNHCSGGGPSERLPDGTD